MRLLFKEVLIKFINVNVICVPVSQKETPRAEARCQVWWENDFAFSKP